ncbi:hypothetical protein O1D87_003442 [Vibrio cholerae]|nr:hypothetical protein [Vibrio cholerae]EKG0039195.1 hypothetical protein [Vibrio cholerae]ELN3183649.1 hypothetical protein [Vibrio cholerae]MBP0925403.1 hypothetical protein [Vibrio cholerae]MCX9465774.1 hypothetical protein [Vibrio cholerae]
MALNVCLCDAFA